jgi:hypothetical protein
MWRDETARLSKRNGWYCTPVKRRRSTYEVPCYVSCRALGACETGPSAAELKLQADKQTLARIRQDLAHCRQIWDSLYIGENENAVDNPVRTYPAPDGSGPVSAACATITTSEYPGMVTRKWDFRLDHEHSYFATFDNGILVRKSEI